MAIKRTHTNDPDFRLLVAKLDHEFWNELNEDQQTYDPLNNVDGVKMAVLYYEQGVPAACGCIKEFDEHTVELKRMFVEKSFRGKGISRIVLQYLENWAIEEGYSYVVLETSIHFEKARKLYKTSGYSLIPNYGPYTGLKESLCMRKELVARS